MKALAYVLGAVMVVAALRLAVTVGLVLILLVILIALFTRPAITLKALAAFALLSAAASQPLAFLLLCAAVIFAGSLLPKSEQ